MPDCKHRYNDFVCEFCGHVDSYRKLKSTVLPFTGQSFFEKKYPEKESEIFADDIAAKLEE